MQQTAKHRRTARVLPLLILIAGSLATWLAATALREREAVVANGEFELRARELVSGVGRRVAFSAQILRGVAGLFASSRRVEPHEFRRYYEGLRLPAYYPGVQAVGYTVFVAGRDKERHVAAMRKRRFPTYDIKPAGARGEYSPVIHIEPHDGPNQTMIGSDLLNNPMWLMAATRARDENRAVLSEQLALARETGQIPQASALVFVPIFRHDALLDSVEQRRSALVGWAYCAIRVGDLLQNYLLSEHGEVARKIALQVFAGDIASATTLMYDSAASSPFPSDGTVVTRKEQILGANWLFRIAPLPAYWSSHPVATGHRNAAITGIALTLLIAVGAWLTLRAHLSITAALRETRHAHRSLADREVLLRTIYDNSTVAIFLADLDGKIIFANRRMAEMFTCPLPDLLGTDFCRLVVVPERMLLQERFTELMTGARSVLVLDQAYRRTDRGEFWGHTAGSPLHDADGRMIGMVAIIEDITEHRQMQEALRTSEMRYRLLADNATDVIWTIDLSGQPTYVSPSVSKLRGYSVREAMHQPLSQWFTVSSSALAQDAIRRLLDAARSGQRSPEASIELEQPCKNGATVWTETKFSGFYDASGRAIGMLGVTRDITERKRIQDRIAHMANHDALTDLPNRVLLADRMEQALTLARRKRTRVALLMVDLDRFKPVNDTFGHAVGDWVLQQVAARMRACVRDSDTVGRIGGDEFAVMLPAVRGFDDALRVADKILLALERPFEMGRRNLGLSASIGVVLYPEHGIDRIELMQNADVAMYRAKGSGRNRVALFGDGKPIATIEISPRLDRRSEFTPDASIR